MSYPYPAHPTMDNDPKNFQEKLAAQCCGTAASSQPPTIREQAESSVGFHRNAADKLDQAVAFFRENPAFDRFIQLVRSGAIQI